MSSTWPDSDITESAKVSESLNLGSAPAVPVPSTNCVSPSKAVPATVPNPGKVTLALLVAVSLSIVSRSTA